MTREEIVKLEDYKTFWKRSSGEIITFTEGTLMDIIQLARRDILSLITTIESQKEEIERLNKQERLYDWLDGRIELVKSKEAHDEILTMKRLLVGGYFNNSISLQEGEKP